MSGFFQKFNLIYLLSFVALIWVVSNVNAETHSDLPPPPTKPDKFTSKQQLKEYLVKLHEYYAIIGRPRFGKRSNLLDFQPFGQEEDSSELFQQSIPINAIIEILDPNQNGLITKKELNNFISLLTKQNI
jgi:hypothetical protein